MRHDVLELHDYQKVARDFLRGRPAAGLFLDMGLGKTAISLSALRPEDLPALVVAPKRVAENVWHAEAALWRPDLSIQVAKGDPNDRHRALASGADIVVLGRDNLKDVPLVFPKTSLPFRTIVIDELSGFKTRASVRWKTLSKIVNKPSVNNVWGLTGTPSPNGMMDLWAQVGLLDNGQRLGRNIGPFRARYFSPDIILPNGTIASWRINPGSDDEITVLIEDICLAMGGKGRIKLPDVTDNDIEVALPPSARKPYDEIESDLVTVLDDVFGATEHTAESSAILTSKLSQIAAGFIFEDPVFEADDSEEGGHQVNAGAYVWLHDESVNAVKEAVDSIQSPVLVFYRFIPERDRLIELLGEKVHLVTEPNLQERWNAGEFPVLLAHPASIGHGLNLQYGGHHIVWASPTWELELWQQGNGRLVRQGQTEPVVIHSVLRTKTIDQLMRRRLDFKEANQVRLLEHLESPV